MPHENLITQILAFLKLAKRTYGDRGPYRAFMPTESTGWWEVLDAKENCVCTCYADPVGQNAKMIADALNACRRKS